MPRYAATFFYVILCLLQLSRVPDAQRLESHLLVGCLTENNKTPTPHPYEQHMLQEREKEENKKYSQPPLPLHTLIPSRSLIWPPKAAAFFSFSPSSTFKTALASSFLSFTSIVDRDRPFWGRVHVVDLFFLRWIMLTLNRLGPNLIRVLPATCITFVVYENARLLLWCDAVWNWTIWCCYNQPNCSRKTMRARLEKKEQGQRCRREIQHGWIRGLSIRSLQHEFWRK